jgi:SAM-dependent methyltransferase
VDDGGITARQRDVWATGDWNVIAVQTMPVADALVEATDLRPGQRVLDVACGTGNCALVAARRYCEAVGLDYVPALVERARARAAADGVAAEFVVGDAQSLPFPDGAFDAVLSTFGAMFAPDQERTAAELLRVCRPGGVVGMANWMPEGFGLDYFEPHAEVAPPPPGLASPLRWGTEEGLAELLGPGAEVTAERRVFHERFRSTRHGLDEFRAFFGPTVRAFEAAGPDGEAALDAALMRVLEDHNDAEDGTAAVRCEYLQVVAVRR